MTGPSGSIPVVDVDQVFPFVTSGTSDAATQRTGDDQTPSVTAALANVLGWRPRAKDTKAFSAALKASFTLNEVEGHIEATHVPRGFAMQADLGAVSGGQASLYLRARSGSDQITRLLDGLVALRPDADDEDCQAFLALVRHGIGQLVDELGNPGGPRHPLVDGTFDMLAGALSSVDAARTRNQLAVVNADTVAGQLGALRDRFGLIDANVNTVDEESIRTSFWTMVDLVIDLRRSWEEWKAFLGGGVGTGFLGTEVTSISRLMHAAADQVRELETVLDSVQVSRSERQTLVLSGQGNAGLTLDGLLAWIQTFLNEQGPRYLRESGRDGIRTAFAPTAERLCTAIQQSLVDPIGPLDHRGTKKVADEKCCPVSYIPASCCMPYPPGLYAARVRIAVSGLCRLMRAMFGTAARISRYPGVVLLDVEFQRLEKTLPDELLFRVSVRGANLRPTYLPAFLVPSSDGKDKCVPLKPLNDSVTADDDTLVGLFAFQTPIRDLLMERSENVVLPAQLLPIEIIDGETGRMISAPPTSTWPDFKLTPGETNGWNGFENAAVDLSNIGNDSAFGSSFAHSTPGDLAKNLLGSPIDVNRNLQDSRCHGEQDGSDLRSDEVGDIDFAITDGIEVQPDSWLTRARVAGNIAESVASKARESLEVAEYLAKRARDDAQVALTDATSASEAANQTINSTISAEQRAESFLSAAVDRHVAAAYELHCMQLAARDAHDKVNSVRKRLPKATQKRKLADGQLSVAEQGVEGANDDKAKEAALQERTKAKEDADSARGEEEELNSERVTAEQAATEMNPRVESAAEAERIAWTKRCEAEADAATARTERQEAQARAQTEREDVQAAQQEFNDAESALDARIRYRNRTFPVLDATAEWVPTIVEAVEQALHQR